MRVSFWLNDAAKLLVGPAWPWLPIDAPAAFAARVRAALDPYWTRRFQRIPEHLLSARARQLVLAARATITADSPAGGGFEKVEAAAAASPEAFWFFELGSAAWILVLHRLRTEGWLPPEPDGVDFEAIERLWRQQGPGAAAQAIDQALAGDPTTHPALALYRVPIALWHDRNPKLAMGLLDRAMTRLSPYATSVMGMTLPLTYGLMHALLGHTDHAATLLGEGRVPGRPYGWVGLNSPEVRYQRARYLWDLKRADDALALLKKVVMQDAAYVVRLTTDPAWAQTHGGTLPSPLSAIGEALTAARQALTLFQQSRTQEEDQVPEVRRVLEVISFAGDEPYLSLAAATLLPAVVEYRESQMKVGPAFYADIERLQQFAQGLPSAMPLRLGPGFRPSFTGGPESDMAHLESLLDHHRFADAADYMASLYRSLPYAVRMASISYAGRLVTALATSAEVLRVRGREEDRHRFETAVQLSERCLGLIDPIKTLPDDVGPQQLYAIQKIWEEIVEIERAWVRSEARAFGTMRLLPGDTQTPIERGSFTAFTVTVVDAAGAPVAGVPVVWRVASGPAFPKDPAECLAGEWALSLQTGVAYLTIEAKGAGDGGVIEARILGNYSPITLPYRVIDPAPRRDAPPGLTPQRALR